MTPATATASAYSAALSSIRMRTDGGLAVPPPLAHRSAIPLPCRHSRIPHTVLPHADAPSINCSGIGTSIQSFSQFRILLCSGGSCSHDLSRVLFETDYDSAYAWLLRRPGLVSRSALDSIFTDTVVAARKCACRVLCDPGRIPRPRDGRGPPSLLTAVPAFVRWPL
ncbi:hypothetical protein EVAR_67204_1 [Eumeta japonica]|uniref:Uncharacterized protein n=1 Tax=Eumeta variegata TaxID=151549 RepID=A0A4C2A7Q6_EUMVA|nr:hypothetical protein EVAR_67204_1 [Eumeta japonica]